MSKDAMMLALEALEAMYDEGKRLGWHVHPKWSIGMDNAVKAITALREALAEPQQEPTDKNCSPCPEFWDWLPKAYNFEGVGNFTKYNMEVAFLAGKQNTSPPAHQEPLTKETEMNNENLIKAMRETMRRQSQVITSLHQQIESLESKKSQDQLAIRRHWLQLTEGAVVDGDTVIIFVKDGNDGARFVCHELRKEKDKLDQQTPTTTPTHSWGKITEVDGGFNGEPENEYVNQKIGPLSDDTDALRWATEFANKFTVWSNDGVEPDTKGLMIAWFANAIMAGVDTATRLEQSRYVELHQWRRIDQPKQSGWFDDSKERAYYSDPGRIEGRTVYVKKVDN